jgi:hypothetical protein
MDTALSTPTDFCLRLARAYAVLVRRFDSALGNHHGISFSDFQLLNHIARAPGGRIRRVDLAERVSLTASGVTAWSRARAIRAMRGSALPSLPRPATNWWSTPRTSST